MRSPFRLIGAATAATLLLAGAAANAATTHTAITGTWDGLHSWNPGQLGGKIVETTAGGGPGMALSGWMEYDDVTGAVQNLYLVGTTWIGPWASAPPNNDVRMQNYAWQSNGTNLNLLPGASRLACDQLGNGVFVTGGSAACGAGYQNGQGTLNLLLDFTGVIPGGITAGPGAGEYLPEQVGFSGTVVGDAVSIYAIKGYNPFIPLAADSTFNLQVVPVPGAVWLFGSALGLLGWARRRSS